jgi:hypothetical protein
MIRKDYPSSVDIKSFTHGFPWRFRHIDFNAGTKIFTVPSGVTCLRACIWGGGAGGNQTYSSFTTSGGTGGGFTEHLWECAPGTILTLVVGAGGVGGGAGGTSSLTDNRDVTLSATGGAGYNNPGQGFGGNIINAAGGLNTYSSNANYRGSGSAAGSWLGTGGAGVVSTTTGRCSGGGAIGGKNGASSYGSGAGVLGDGQTQSTVATVVTGGPGFNNPVAGNAQTGALPEDAVRQTWFDIYELAGPGGCSAGYDSGGYNVPPGNGGEGGGGGGGSHTAGPAANGGHSFMFGGGGAGYINGGNGGLGGGGGGAGSSASVAGKGGSGMIILYW